MKRYFLFGVYILFIIGCLSTTLESEEVFEGCDTTTNNYFNPTNKTFIPPAKSNFIDFLCMPLELGNDISYFDLTANKVCQLEQHLGMIADSINTESCEKIPPNELLDSYYYQYVGIRIGEQDYIFVNAFHESELDSFNWKQEPFIGNCRNGLHQWYILFDLDQLSFSQYRSHTSFNIYHFAEFPYSQIECHRCITNQNLKAYELKKTDLCLLQEHFEKLKDIKSIGCYLPNNFIDFDGRRYLYQYTGAKEGNKLWLYINGYSAIEDVPDEEYYQSPFICVYDAGLSYWGVLFDLETHEFSDLQFNFPR